MAWMNVLNENMTEADVENVLLCFPHQPDSCPRAHRFLALKVPMYFLMLASILMTVFGNLLVIITISHFKQLHSPTNLIVLSLALVDCLLGCLVMPFSMVRWLERCWFLGDVFCKIHSSLDMTLSIVSILHLSLVSIDRYLAICEPLSYRMRVTNGTVAVCIAFIWLFSLTFSFGVVLSEVNITGLENLLMLNSCGGNCALIFNKQWGVIAALVAFFIPGTIMSSLYLKIFHVARKQAKVMSERATVRRTSCEMNVQSSEQRERKAAKTLGIVMGIFLLCWLPFFIATIIDPFLDFSTPVDVFDALVWFGYLNSTFNPLVYGFFYPRFQSAFKIIISKYVLHLRNASQLVL
ncbi:trace amine-associated receptor 4-like [Pygocentrus nattereri]|uniref:trace amine-associated receptor 4-like n=1 Tax=Pygocentrus nattereri TaxID=42514 RepID=UPI001890BBBB|nr:trace amine-associated receptor 4-like [Pygocentrus nattereri]